ncbi:Fic family protein [Legionella londiniensis]|uniref:Fido domain-containing protein n=1 Tax=Legionella londiniensis TaxID=45068 RepID=A0A0W0VHG0_9GAMM|nr:Fic family protein [Legionella londiniensis]KTD19584.1 hypothetical protein Llon_2164 [Legionella londiniensis]STX92193.1 Uncharacterised protein [Legionella londiniensis]
MIQLLEFCKSKLDARLKTPYVSKDYTETDKANLYSGLQIALDNSKTHTSITKDQIIRIFNAMNPGERDNMMYPTRRKSVCFCTNGSSVSKEGLQELFDWADKHHAGYGPRIEIIDNQNAKEHFKTMGEMRKHYHCANNQALAEKLYPLLADSSHHLIFVPIFDSINPFYGQKNLSHEEKYQLLFMQDQLNQFEVFNAVELKFDALLKAFNQKKNPSLRNIAAFIKDMILLHPFPNGNGRTFTLGVLNQLLLQHGHGICLHFDPHLVAGLAIDETAEKIKEHLIPMEQLTPYLAKTQGNANAKQAGFSLNLAISLQVIGQFTAVLGIAAVALGIVLLAANIMLPAVIFAGIGSAAALVGVGLFAVGKSIDKSNRPSLSNLAMAY